MDGERVALFCKQVTDKTFQELRAETAEQRQSTLPFDQKAITAEGVRFVEIHDDGTVSVAITKVVENITVERLPSSDPLAVRAIQQLNTKQ